MDGRVVVITGASSGVGRATARAFAHAGADLALLARGRHDLEITAKEVESSGRRAAVFPTDVADPDQVEASASEIERTLGPIDVWVNDAMVSVFSPFLEMSPEEFRRVTEVTYLGVVHGTYAALRRMVPRDRGVIVQVGSALAYRGIPLQSAYCGAKHAVQGFHGVRPLRAPPRAEPRPDHDGPASGPEHAALRGGLGPAPTGTPARPPDL
jgi:NAD(P)-dependent dehydrogenase (short-subunit alcohol dehydrogenase family)